MKMGSIKLLLSGQGKVCKLSRNVSEVKKRFLNRIFQA